MSLCVCGHDIHAENEPTVCTMLQCDCNEFRPTENKADPNQLRNQIDGHIYELDALELQARWLLEKYPYLRDESTDKWIDFYFEHVKFYIRKGRTKKPAMETVSRVRRHLAKLDPCKYGSSKNNVQTYRDIKQVAYHKHFSESRKS